MHAAALKLPLAALAVGGLFKRYDAGAAGIAVFGNVAAAGTLVPLIWEKTDPRPVGHLSGGDQCCDRWSAP